MQRDSTRQTKGAARLKGSASSAVDVRHKIGGFGIQSLSVNAATMLPLNGADKCRRGGKRQSTS